MLDEMKKKEEEEAGGAAQRADGEQPVEKANDKTDETGTKDSVKTHDGVASSSTGFTKISSLELKCLYGAGEDTKQHSFFFTCSKIISQNQMFSDNRSICN